ncbi:hypothetical protein [Falsiroseomonas sp.]|uniref:hypothetical protein n=1 Tax=Falsiroseomonas sp. TaxID=2870721 RepID=UPI0035614CFD
MRDGTVPTMNEAAIIREAKEISSRAWSRLFAERPDIEIPGGFRPLPAHVADGTARVAMQTVSKSG